MHWRAISGSESHQVPAYCVRTCTYTRRAREHCNREMQQLDQDRTAEIVRVYMRTNAPGDMYEFVPIQV
jgi:hypothetical protein